MNVKTALITGAAKRIGAAIACSLHAAGMNVVIHYHKSEAEAGQLCASLNGVRPGTAGAIRADLSDESSYRRVVDFTCDRFGGLDVLVNNASAFFPTPVADTTLAQWDELMATNLKGPFFLSQAAAGALRDARGCIVNVTDIHAFRPLKGYSVYSTAKAALIMLTQALAKELAPEIRANAVAPGAILWPEDMGADLKQRIVSHTVLRRPGNPADIAGAVRYLIFDAGYVTGQVLTIDGGRTLYS
ncbi:MAG: pteridine reductase [Gammaproteobacteria bacterium]